MNWINKILVAGKNIKERIRERASREEIRASKWMSPCCGNTPILKSSIFNDEQLNTCPNCDKHFPFPPVDRMNHFFGKNLMQQLLESEGIEIKNDKVVNFENIFWDPSFELK